MRNSLLREKKGNSRKLAKSNLPVEGDSFHS